MLKHWLMAIVGAAISSVVVDGYAKPPLKETIQPSLVVYGLRLGRKMDLPSCPMTDTGRLNLHAWSGRRAKTCVEPTPTKTSVDKRARVFHLHFNARALPADFGAPIACFAVVLDGKLDGLEIHTAVAVEDGLFARLDSTYGAPSDIRKSTTVSYERGEWTTGHVIGGTWQFKTLRVTFDGKMEKESQGMLQISASRLTRWTNDRRHAWAKRT